MGNFADVLTQGDDTESWDLDTHRGKEMCKEDKKAVIPTHCHSAILPFFPLKFG